MEISGLFFACLPNQGSHYHASQDFIPPPVCHPQRPRPSLGWAHEHVSSSPPLGVCWSRQSTGVSTLQASSCSRGFAPRPPFLFLSLALFPGIDSDVECLGMSTRTYCLHCFLCMTLYAVSMLKKTEKKKNHSAKPIYVFWTKKIEVVLSVSDSEICCCLSVLLASVWPCFASMRYCPLWRILGEEEPHPQGFRGGTDPPKPLGSPGWWVEQDGWDV